VTDVAAEALGVVRDQLSRMRSMDAAYHARFFSDVRWTTAMTLALFVAGFAVDTRMFMAIPVVTLLGACQTAFDATYLIFSRQYASRLERWINVRLGREVLVAHRIEDVYLFPLDTPKAVTFTFDRFSWFGFMTALSTVIGAGVYLAGLSLALDAVREHLSVGAGAAYVAGLAVVTATALGIGTWWFAAGEGERRIRQVLDASFPAA